MKKINLIILLLVLVVTLSAQFGKNKVQVDKIDWSVIETLHFDIYYPKGADDFGRKAALMAEKTYYYLQDAFQLPLYERVPIIFYESHREFQVTNIIYPLLMEGVGGFTESLRNRVVIPYDGSYKKLEETLIHELTHAYVNSIDNEMHSARFFNIHRMPFPFWFDEGLPEYLSVGGQDNYNNMFVMDMVLNSEIEPLELVGGFYAYRLGESFLTYIDSVYGRLAVMQLFFAAKTAGSMDSASQKTFGMDFEQIQKRWRNYLLRRYSPYINSQDIPYEIYDKRTDHEKQGSYFNFAPRFAPDGNSYLYYSNRDRRMSIWRGLTIDIFDDNMIIRGETRGRFEQFHFLRSNISWFPDSRHFAFTAKTERGDVIYIMDVQTERVINSIQMFDFDAIYELDICRKGEKIVFSGQKKMNNNIYIMDIETKEVTAVTQDPYYDHQPRWHPDGEKILFVSERFQKEEAKYDHIFSRLTDQVFYYDIESDEFFQVTDDQFNNHSPMWNSSGTSVIFISEQDNVSNFHTIDLTTGQRAIVTNTLAGVFIGDLTYNEDMLIFSAFYGNGWNIYTHRNPLLNLEYQDYGKPQPVVLKDDFNQQFDIHRYRYFGKDESFIEELAEKDKETAVQRKDTAFYRVRKSTTLHPKPTAINEPQVKSYRPRFFLDRLWGGLAYSSAYGTIGSLQLGLSDVMGDHTIGIQLGITESFENSSYLFTYLYLPRRIDYGFGGFYLNDDYLFYSGNQGEYSYYYVRERDVGALSLVSYPFNRFWRLDFENLLYRRSEWYEGWDESEKSWVYLEQLDTEGFVYSPQVKLVHDNILYGYTGPMTGWRGLLRFSKIFAERYNNFHRIDADLRHYRLFAKNYSFATRLLLGRTDAESQANKLRLDGTRGVRGFTDSRVRGRNKAVGTMELRFPFIEKLDMKFPLPLTITHVRGSIFTDIGAVWDDHQNFTGMRDGRLEDIVLGFGMGPRLNLGYFVLKLDITWTTDLSSTGKASYWWSINEEF